MNDALLDDVRRFVADERAVDVYGLTPDSELLDLGIAGDDGVDLLDAFAKRFGVYMTGCDPYLHVGPEGWPTNLLGCVLVPLLPLYSIACWLLGRGPHEPELVPIRIRDLVVAARAKSWEATNLIKPVADDPPTRQPWFTE